MSALSLTTILATSKTLIGIARDANKAEAVAQAMDFQQQLVELWEAHVALKDEAAELRKALRYQGELQWSRNAYWFGAGRDETSGPLCPRCWPEKRLPVRMLRINYGVHRCPICNTLADADPDRPPVTERMEDYDPLDNS